MPKVQAVSSERERSRLEEFKAFIGVIANQMALPLYFLFWICDLIYVPQLKWEFLGLRALVVPATLIVPKLMAAAPDSRYAQRLALGFTAWISVPISTMVWISDGALSPYYAGLNLIAVGTLSFLPWSRRYFVLTALAIFAPYVLCSLIRDNSLASLRHLAIHGFFIVGTVTISILIRHFTEALRSKEIESRLQLQDEVENRNRIILEKTNEAVKLATLSSQFSPQVVDAIRSGAIDVSSSVHRSQICALFIDIVNSTERVLRVDKDDVFEAISLFMEDSIKTLLKYDITIDKFLGDGILAFSNDPVQYDDYVERVVRASLELREKIKSRQDEYETFWLKEMQIRIGIAVGVANVGFYGNEKYYYRSYTAIGPVVNLASRLCSTAEPNQIVISQDVLDALGEKRNRYVTSFVGKKSLKGFENDAVKAFAIDGLFEQNLSPGDEMDCRQCRKGMLFLTTDAAGLYIFKCRTCGSVQNSLDRSSGHQQAS